MGSSYRAPKGTKDILPDETARWQHVERVARELLATYRYAEIRTPIFEALDLFARGVGEHTDIVSKEMYTFSRKGEREDEQLFALRPENTAGVARAYVEHKLYAEPAPQKLWYLGPMFRYERPQAGRQRQFHQLGVECLGSEDARWDAECIVMAADMLERLEVGGLEVQLNSVGCEACRPAYRERLQAHLRAHEAGLCQSCVVRAEKNPLRVLDCKVPACAPIIEAAPPLSEGLCEACRDALATVSHLLGVAGLPYRLNLRLVRGLDYYTRTVFEVVAETGLGSQNTVLAGGRYNKLVEEVGGPPTPGVGWAMGMERLMMLLAESAVPVSRLDALFVARGDAASERAFQLARELRRADFTVELGAGGKIDKQFKQAERLGARFALILGEDELTAGEVTVKDLDRREQQRVAQADLAGALARIKAGALA